MTMDEDHLRAWRREVVIASARRAARRAQRRLLTIQHLRRLS